MGLFYWIAIILREDENKMKNFPVLLKITRKYGIICVILFHGLNVYKKFKQNLAYMDFAQNFLCAANTLEVK